MGFRGAANGSRGALKGSRGAVDGSTGAVDERQKALEELQMAIGGAVLYVPERSCRVPYNPIGVVEGSKLQRAPMLHKSCRGAVAGSRGAAEQL